MTRYQEWIKRAKSSLDLAKTKITQECLEWVENTIKEIEEKKQGKRGQSRAKTALRNGLIKEN